MGVTLLIRLCWAGAMEMGNDEAYHYLYTVHPDWSYFDHPPCLMWVASAGKILCGGWVHQFSLRLGFILLFAGSTWVLFDWTARWFGESAGFFAALALNLAAYYSAAAGAFVLPDGPFLFFALLTMRALCEALFKQESTRSWILVGLACAGAMASKYHGILLPFGTVVYVAVTPSAWKVLKTKGPYLAALLALAGLAPVLAWNLQHDWASFAFQGARAVGARFSPVGLAIMIFGPIGYLLPWIWVPSMMVLTNRLWNIRRLEGVERFLICMSIVPLGLFFCVSCLRPILPHWPLIGFVPLLPMVGNLWAENSERNPILVRRWIAFMSIFLLATAGFFLAQARFGVVDFPWQSDPAREISGWTSVGKELDRIGLTDRANTFLFTEHWYDSGQLAFSIRNRLPVTCYNAGDARGFAYWSNPQEWVGKDGLFVSVDETQQPERFRRYFREVEFLTSFDMTRGGKPFRPVHIYLCTDQIEPFPFAPVDHK
jgi:4-amino-4-deoxy-L-arabinose transferase-like glycosyltransferase